MAAVVWSPEALADVGEAIDFIAKESYHYAERVADAIFERTTMLISHPFQGRIIPELQNPVQREVFEHHYRIMYSVSALPNIEILRVIHMSRNFLEL